MHQNCYSPKVLQAKKDLLAFDWDFPLHRTPASNPLLTYRGFTSEVGCPVICLWNEALHNDVFHGQ
jgi:hypothetical protein